jgi:hypothetical protein
MIKYCIAAFVIACGTFVAAGEVPAPTPQASCSAAPVACSGTVTVRVKKCCGGLFARMHARRKDRAAARAARCCGVQVQVTKSCCN